MTTYARLHKRATSLKNDRSILGAHILPALGATNVAEVTRDDVRKLHASLSDKRVQANRVHALLSALMRYAVEKELRADNPCAGLKRYKEHARSCIPRGGN